MVLNESSVIGRISLLLDKRSSCFFCGNYCKSGNFRENFIFVNSVKLHICDVKHLQLGHDPISVNDILISPFREDFISRNFAFAKFRGNKPLAKILEFTVMIASNALIHRFRKTTFLSVNCIYFLTHQFKHMFWEL